MVSLLHLLYLLLLTATVAAALPPPPRPLLEHHTIRGAPFPSTSNTTKLIDPTLPWGLPSHHDLTPICSLPLLQFNLSSTSPSIFSSNYTPPDSDQCPWTSASLHISAYAEGTGSLDRIGSVWLGAVELLRTATPVPTDAGVLWSVRKDVTRYSAALSRDGVVSMALESPVNDADSTLFRVNVTLNFYGAPGIRSVASRGLKSDTSTPAVKQSEKLHLLYGKPADMIIPLTSLTPEGQEEDDYFWYRIRDETDEFMDAVSIPNNTRRAVLEIYVSGHAADEFWYAKPPSYLYKGADNGPIRQVSVTVDGLLVGTSVPFPAVYSGGVDPLLWTPVAPVESFVLPSHDVELTPILGRLLDGEPHAFVIGIAGAHPFWLVGANLHLWLDPGATAVSAGLIRCDAPGFTYSTKTKRGPSLREFQEDREGELTLAGWVASSLGNLTTEVKEEVEVEGKVTFQRYSNGADVEEVEFEAKYEREVKVVEGMWNVLAKMEQKTKFPLEFTAAVTAVGDGTYSRSDVKVSRGLEEEVKVTYGQSKRKSKVKNKEEGEGWMVVEGKGGALVDGSATMEHKYFEKSPGVGSCERKVKVMDGVSVEDEVSGKTCSGYSDI